MSVRFSCVVDDHPRFTVQAWIWCTTLRALAGRSSAELVIHVVDGTAGDRIDYLRGLDVEVRVVPPFDERHAYSNKLVQLGSPALAELDRVVLTDCDIAFAGPVSELLDVGRPIAAKRVDTGNPDHTHWARIFAAAGFGPPETAPGTHIPQLTYRYNLNGGVYVLTRPAFEALGEAWPRWNRWLGDRPEVLDGWAFYRDQVSFGLAVHELGLPVESLSSRFNFPTQHPNVEAVVPSVLHYHRRFDADGLLLAHGAPEVDARIAEVNAALTRHRHTAPSSCVRDQALAPE
ncbi:hypothetical protein [Micromonospora sp. NPDC049645]|uniref:hypothetical protein n=1 Tax=Micromonospora sp. NPDC049645 TaxID=3155508 RepID=UPI00342303BE